jgi:hypothetical protein
MPQSIIIGVHGLYNKPPKAVLEDWWSKAIAEGLDRNFHMSLRSRFCLAYWADVRDPNRAPVAVTADDEPYEKAAGEGRLRPYDGAILDKVRAVAQKWGGRVLDKEKELIGLGPNVEAFLGVKLDDLAVYYDAADIRRTMRSRVSELVENNKDKRIMLIAHSMGSIIAYDVMRGYDESQAVKIEHFVTVGSPLGLPLVRYKVREEFGVARIPRAVRHWTNIADPEDRVALDCNLTDEYRTSDGVRVEDILVHNEYVNRTGKANSHKIYGYLRAVEMSALIKSFLDQGH